MWGHISDSQSGAILPPRGHLAISGDIFDWEVLRYLVLGGQEWCQKSCNTQANLHNKSYRVQNVSSVCCQGKPALRAQIFNKRYSQDHPAKQVLSCPFYKWGNRGLESLRDSSRTHSWAIAQALSLSPRDPATPNFPIFSCPLSSKEPLRTSLMATSSKKRLLINWSRKQSLPHVNPGTFGVCLGHGVFTWCLRQPRTVG